MANWPPLCLNIHTVLSLPIATPLGSFLRCACSSRVKLIRLAAGVHGDPASGVHRRPARIGSVSVCLPVNKRTVVPWLPEEPAAAVPFLPAPVCLPAKKHTYALPADAVLPPCQGARECTAAEGCGRFHMRARPRAGASAEGRVFRPHLLTGQQACDAASIHGLRWFSIWHCQRSQASRIQQTRWWRHHSQSKCQGSCSIGKTRCAMLKLG